MLTGPVVSFLGNGSDKPLRAVEAFMGTPAGFLPGRGTVFACFSRKKPMQIIENMVDLSQWNIVIKVGDNENKGLSFSRGEPCAPSYGGD